MCRQGAAAEGGRPTGVSSCALPLLPALPHLPAPERARLGCPVSWWLFTWQTPANFGEQLHSGRARWELPCWDLVLLHLLHPRDSAALDLGGRQPTKPRSLTIPCTLLKLPPPRHATHPPCHPCTMHLLGLFSLVCYLAAAALLLGPREPATAAAYESGQGYYEEEPDLGEAKLFEITVPLSHGPKPVTVSFANHTSCRCMSKLDVYRQVHSIIRRSLPATQPQCHVANKTCPKNLIWNNQICRCLVQHDFSFSSHHGDTDTADEFHDICGPNKELDEETCQCVCKGGVRPSSCEPQKELDRTSCQCTCKNKFLPSSCGPNKEFDEDKCQCVCKRTCPKHQPLNSAKCICECIESPNKCFLKGKRFHHQTCSCYRPPCTVRTKRCEPGFYYSEEVCRCVPTYWKRPLIN
ncbi:vascular endothelial growth factor C isoform X3 [Dermochelys coriacea]|uniref:vascular endothelial growth factor C isoform X3 n=1 Tax=Dermochelys coriacea TaxID=27794 RepID=UPI001CA8B918|nr:vascular endothelial growth factor C isoform X3 [Dermochelys coriacea]